MPAPISPNVYSDDFGKRLILIQYVTNVLSTFGSLFIVGMYMIHIDLRSFAYKLVMMLAVADVILGVGRSFNISQYFQDNYEPLLNFNCYLQAFLSTFGSLSTIMATMAISWSLSQSVINNVTNLSVYKWYYYSIIFLLPFCVALVPFATGDYGISEISCWIAEENVAAGRSALYVLYWRMALFFIPLWISILYNFLNYLRIYHFVESVIGENDDEVSKQHSQMIRKLIYYPLIMVICYLFATINRIYTFIQPHENHVIVYLHVTLGGLQGFFNAFVYGFNPQIKAKLYSSCCLSKSSSQDKNAEEAARNTSFQSSSSSLSNVYIHDITDFHGSTQIQMREKLGHDIYSEYGSRVTGTFFDIQGPNKFDPQL